MSSDNRIILNNTIKSLNIISDSKNNQEIDLRDATFITPFLITPISAFMKSSFKKYKILKSKIYDVNSYLDTINFPDGFNVDLLNQMNFSTYCLFQFSKENAQYDKKIADICDKLINSYGLKTNQNIMVCFLGELFDNIREHSKSLCNFIGFQKYRENLAISIVDRGITIPRSYEENEISFKDDIEALKFVLKGISTKKENERGTGIPNTLNWVCDALKGHLLVISRNGGFYKNNNNEIDFFKLPKKMSFEGTIINTYFEIPKGKIDYTKYINK